MGLIKLAIIGGAGYWAVKKNNEIKNGKQCNRRGYPNASDRDIDQYNGPQQYHDNPQQYRDEKHNPTQQYNDRNQTERYNDQNRSEKQLPQYQEQPYYRYEPQYRDQQVERYEGGNEKSGMREIKN